MVALGRVLAKIPGVWQAAGALGLAVSCGWGSHAWVGHTTKAYASAAAVAKDRAEDLAGVAALRGRVEALELGFAAQKATLTGIENSAAETRGGVSDLVMHMLGHPLRSVPATRPR